MLYGRETFNNENTCKYKSPRFIWDDIIKSGLVTNECIPYYISLLKNLNSYDKCVLPSIKFTKYYIKNNNVIKNNRLKAMRNIYKYGPIMAEINIFEDFSEKNARKNTNSDDIPQSIYEYSSGRYSIKMSIKIIGWNMLETTPYWIVMIPLGTKVTEKVYIKFGEGNFDKYFYYSDVILNDEEEKSGENEESKKDEVIEEL